MTTAKVKSADKIHKAPEPVSAIRTNARQPGAGASRGGFDTRSLSQIGGNLAMQSLLRSGPIQAKLAVSQPNDPDEQEADRIADTVIRITLPVAAREEAFQVKANSDLAQVPVNTRPLPVQPLEGSQEDRHKRRETRSAFDIQLRIAEDNKEKTAHNPASDSRIEKEEPIRDKGLPHSIGRSRVPGKETAAAAANRAQQQPADNHDNEDVRIQAAGANAPTPQPTASAAAHIHALSHGGSLLPQAARDFFEPRFGADFSHVRVHTGRRAEEAAKSIRAKAFTVGRDIAFGEGQYQPNSDEGRRLLAHELTHTLQQSSGWSADGRNDLQRREQSRRVHDAGKDRVDGVIAQRASSPRVPEEPLLKRALAEPKVRNALRETRPAIAHTGSPTSDDRAKEIEPGSPRWPHASKAIVQRTPVSIQRLTIPYLTAKADEQLVKDGLGGDIVAINEIRNFGAVDTDTRFKLLDRLINQGVEEFGGRDPSTVSKIWASFPDLEATANANAERWKKSAERSPQLASLPRVKELKDQFAAAVRDTAKSYIDTNRSIIRQEQIKYGVLTFDNEKPAPVDEEQRRNLINMQSAAEAVAKNQKAQEAARQTLVGYKYGGSARGQTFWMPVTFDPYQKPERDTAPTKDDPQPTTTWDKMNVAWEASVASTRKFLKEFPALYAVSREGSSALTTNFVNKQTPEQARSFLARAMEALIKDIQAAEKALDADGKLNPLDLTPISEGLMGGKKNAVGSSVEWGKPVASMAGREAIKDHQLSKALSALGYTVAAEAMFLLAPFTGGASLFFLLGGLGVLGAKAGESQQQFEMLSQAAKTAVTADTELVTDKEVSMAAMEAQADKDALALAALTIVGAAAVGAISVAVRAARLRALVPDAAQLIRLRQLAMGNEAALLELLRKAKNATEAEQLLIKMGSVEKAMEVLGVRERFSAFRAKYQSRLDANPELEKRVQQAEKLAADPVKANEAAKILDEVAEKIAALIFRESGLDPEVAEILRFNKASLGEAAQAMGVTENQLARELSQATGAARDALLARMRAATTPAVSGGWAGFMGWSASIAIEQLRGMRKALLARTDDVAAVGASVRRLGYAIDDDMIRTIKRYNFDSPGIAFSRDNFEAWNRLAAGKGTIGDIRYTIHEAEEVTRLKKVQQRTGFDFLGANWEKMTPVERAKWRKQFMAENAFWATDMGSADQFVLSGHYISSHGHALEQEFAFIAEQAGRLSNGRVRVTAIEAAAMDITASGGEAREFVLRDGLPLAMHPDIARWQARAGEIVQLDPKLRAALGPDGLRRALPSRGGLGGIRAAEIAAGQEPTLAEYLTIVRAVPASFEELMEEKDIAETLEWLTALPAQDRATMLEVLAQGPTGEARVRQAIEALLDDRSVVAAGPPPRWTELRCLAAAALAAERGAVGIVEPVTLSALPPSLGLLELEQAAATTFGVEAARWRPSERYRRLRDAQALPLAETVFRSDLRTPGP